MKFNKISAIFMSLLALASTTFVACSDEHLDTNPYAQHGVNIVSFGPMPVNRGETMKLTGTQLYKVRQVLFPEGNQKLVPSKTYINADFTMVNENQMLVTIPDMCVPGKLRLVTDKNDTVVSVSNLTFVEKTKVDDIQPRSGVRAGDVVSITGEFCWNIAAVTFASATTGVTVEAEDFLLNTRKEIQVRIPVEAVSGLVTYNNGEENAIETDIASIEIYGATIAENLTPEADFGQTVKLRGADFDLVTKVSVPFFESVDFQVNADYTELTFVVPATTTEGDITLTMLNGYTVTTPLAPKMVKVTEISNNAKDLRVGDEVVIKGENFDRVVEVIMPEGFTVDGCNGVLSGNTFKFTVPEEFNGGKVLFKQHENYTAESPKMAMHTDDPEYAIWEGNFSIGNWDGGMGDLSWGGYDWNEVQVGQTLSVYFTPRIDEGGYCQVRIGNGSWSALPSTKAMGDNDGNIAMTADDNVVRVTLTEADLNELRNNGGLVICGAWFTVTKVTLSALEAVLWEGEAIADDWGNQPYLLSDAGEELQAAGAKAGQTVFFYLETLAADWKLQVVEGHWGPTYGSWCSVGNDTEDGKFEEYDLAANGGKVSIVLTQEMLDAAFTQQWWGGVFVLNGDNVKCTKITLK